MRITQRTLLLLFPAGPSAPTGSSPGPGQPSYGGGSDPVDPYAPMPRHAYWVGYGGARVTGHGFVSMKHAPVPPPMTAAERAREDDDAEVLLLAIVGLL
jgi:hypothetical protein